MKMRVFFTCLLVLGIFAIELSPRASADTGNNIKPPSDIPVIIDSSSNSSDGGPIISRPVNALEPVVNEITPYVAYGDREMRASWIATVKNINMPAGMDETAFRLWAEESILFLKNNGLNTAVFQVRPTGDALYRSSLVPWSSFITDKAQGTDPGYDPLGIMVETAHKHGIELHAWLNPYRITMPSDSTDSLSPTNIAAKNPSYLVQYGGQYYLNPGIPEVSAHFVEVVKEIVTNYDVDAIHMDDYFYPYPVSGQEYNDSLTFSQYGADYDNIGDWRRDNVTRLVRDVYNGIKSIKPYVQFGISPFGVWRNKSSDPTGSDTTAGHECYDSLYADTRLWIKEGIIDYIAPQIYWSTEFKAADYDILADWWNNEITAYANTRPVKLYFGLADYKVNNDNDVKWGDVNQISAQIDINRAKPLVFGQMHYSIASMKENALGHVDNLRVGQYNSKKLTPEVYTQNFQKPLDILSLTISDKTSSSFNINTPDPNTRKFVIYRFDGRISGNVDENTEIYDIIYKSGNATSYTDNGAVSGAAYTYEVKPVSSFGIVNDNVKIITLTR
ncbi:MAG: family 10 glycosylhydrolase [Clostridiales bacterium]|jgi:uncharacterized lipoprotein YddW (UPF0748 family)|nr:family 10 glycosylhydrolase [Clostridiales bacterium]